MKKWIRICTILFIMVIMGTLLCGCFKKNNLDAAVNYSTPKGLEKSQLEDDWIILSKDDWSKKDGDPYPYIGIDYVEGTSDLLDDSEEDFNSKYTWPGNQDAFNYSDRFCKKEKINGIEMYIGGEIYWQTTNENQKVYYRMCWFKTDDSHYTTVDMETDDRSELNLFSKFIKSLELK